MTRTGRPPKETDEILAARINFALLPEEKAEFEKAAEQAELKVSAWIRDRLMNAAKQELKPRRKQTT